MNEAGKPAFQTCVIFDEVTPAGRPFVRVCGAEAGRTEVSADLRRVHICIPTRNLEAYVIETVERVAAALDVDVEELGADPRLFRIVVLSNGSLNRENLEKFVERFHFATNVGLPVTLIHTETPGKSNALNLLSEFARLFGAGQLFFIDDDVQVAPGVISHLYRLLASGSAAFLGVPTRPVPASQITSTADAIYRMTVVKRKLMGFPMPIGRFMALPVAIFPVINDYSVNDDVFLSAHFFTRGIPQRVLAVDGVSYPTSGSLFEFVKRKRRIATSDERVVSLVPVEARSAFYKACIRPDPVGRLTDEDNAWRRIEDELYGFATRHLLANDVDLTETDLSSKPGRRALRSSDGPEEILERELDRLKRQYLLFAQ
ncbi:MAG: glycosyltransferase [Burkholderiales bacterium]|nr:glycosyltransferase [Burkholderiales bacterium]